MARKEQVRPRIIVSGGRPGPDMISDSVKSMVRMLKKRGAEVILRLDHEGESAADDLADADGIVVMGNNLDVPPWMYDRPQHPRTRPTDNDHRLAYEWDAIEIAVERAQPYTGICYGSQLLNVILGGGLVQHVPDEVPHVPIRHWNLEQLRMGVHAVRLVAGQWLAGLFDRAGLESSTVFVADTGEESERIVDTNSGHHQANDPLRLGRGVKVAAWSVVDRIVEAIEVTGRNAVGIQWHPELTPNHPLTAKIIDDIVERAQAYAREQRPRRDARIGAKARELQELGAVLAA